jgi:hypothetical protein
MLEADEISAGSWGVHTSCTRSTPRDRFSWSSRLARLTVLCLFGLLAGCASPAARLAKYKSDRELEEALVDDTFPNAADVGLAVSN